VARRLFVPMALTIWFAMAASYLVSMTIDPVLSMRFLRARRPDGSDEEPGTRAGGAMARVERSSSRLLDRLDAGYQRLLELALQRRRWVLGTITVLFVLSMGAARLFGSSSFRGTEEGPSSFPCKEPKGAPVRIPPPRPQEAASG